MKQILGLISLSVYFLISISAFGQSKDFNDNTELITLNGTPYLLDLRYASDNNFLHRAIYKEHGLSTCLVHMHLAKKLETIKKDLEDQHLQLVLLDCFRPLAVQKAMWDIMPDRRYVANPKNGSNHNRAAAIDVALADENGKILLFPTAFDDFTSKAAAHYKCPKADILACKNRDLLFGLMKKAGLKGINSEWWHFELQNARQYPIIE